VSETVHVLEATGLGRRFRRKWALQDCTLAIPSGRVAALVGPNGAGKSTLLRIAAGLIPPSTGSLKFLGADPQSEAHGLRQRIGYLDQDRPMYSSFRVKEILHFGRSSNPTWNMDIAERHLARLNIPLNARVSNLSGGQQAQVALTVCLAKEPELLLLDEPAAELDPVAREDLLRLLMHQVAESGSSVVLSTHALNDVSAICDFVVVLAHSRVVLANDIEFVLESHRLLSAVHDKRLALPPGVTVIDEQHSAREASVLARIELPFFDSVWTVEQPTLEEIVMAYLRMGASPQVEIGVEKDSFGFGGSR
jgi:ABC-2 type transport system ATP-binding protein